MKKRILLVEDFSESAIGIMSRLNEIANFKLKIDWVDNCDKALNKLKQIKNYDLIITDLHFKDNNDPSIKIIEGEDLLIQVKKIKKHPPIVVYSMIDQPATLDLIVNNIGVDGYIIKGRKSLEELAYSLNLIFLGGQYTSREVTSKLKKFKNALQIDRLDRNILRKLYHGYKIKELPEILKKDGCKTCSQPTIENKIRVLKEYFNAKTTIQLVAIALEQKVFYP